MFQRGFTLVEAMVTVAITGILLALGLSFFTTVIASTRTRATAESLMSGLQMARAEAIRRNAPMRFNLVSAINSGCGDSTSSALWVVTQTDQTSPTTAHGLVTAGGYCNAQPWLPPDQIDPCNPDHGRGTCAITPAPNGGCWPRPTANPSNCSDDPWIAFKSTSDVPASILITATASAGGSAASVVTFGPLGQLLSNIDGKTTLGYILVEHASDAGAKRWAVRIGVNGAIKLCDPAAAAGTPLACS